MSRGAVEEAALTEVQLRVWGRAIGERVQTPVLFALAGELGAGKSVLARAIARGAGVRGNVPSPTFNLMFRYPVCGDRAVVHVDLYRLDRWAELAELGWDELGATGEIVVVEWPERAGPHLAEPRWDIELAYVRGRPDLRRVRVSRHGLPPDLPPLPPGAEPPRP